MTNIPNEARIPVTEEEAEYLHQQGWSSGFGWKDQLDWYWRPSGGPDIWIEDDAEKMALWLEDRAVYKRQKFEEGVRGAAHDLYDALDALTEAVDHRDLFLNPDALDQAADEIDCGPGCDRIWHELGTNASGCRASEKGEYCPNDAAETLREIAKVARQKCVREALAKARKSDR